MGLFSFFNKTKKTGEDSTVQSHELINDDLNQSSEEVVETTLSYHPSWNVPKEQQYVFSFLSNELPPLKPNQISLSGIDIDTDEGTGDWLVKAFFRSSIDKAITLGNVELLILTEDGQPLASKEFNLSVLDEIPARSNRPWVFVFEKSFLRTAELPADGWKLAFNVQSLVPHRIDFDPAWDEALSDEQKEALDQIVSSLPKLKDREINFSGFQVKPQVDGSLAVSLFIRNGHSQHINVDNIPLEVRDAVGDPVARGSFALNSLEVKANTSKPWTFIFPREMVTKPEADFSRWSVSVPQQS